MYKINATMYILHILKNMYSFSNKLDNLTDGWSFQFFTKLEQP